MIAKIVRNSAAPTPKKLFIIGFISSTTPYSLASCFAQISIIVVNINQ